MYRARLLVLFATQTGSAKEVAERIDRDALRRCFDTRTMSIQDFNMSDLASPSFDAVIFVVSTTGQGEFPDSMRAFWQRLMSKDVGVAPNLQFTVFGLGDSSYPLFNASARKLHQRLLDCGAVAFYARGLGDDQDPMRYDSALEPWLTGLWQRLDSVFPLPAGVTPPDLSSLPSPMYSVQIQSRDSNVVPLSTNDLAWFTSPSTRTLRLRTNRRMTAVEHDQDVRHIELDIDNMDGMEYEPGDVACIYPQNSSHDVSDFLSQYQLKPDDVLSITPLPSHRGHAISTPITAHDLFTYYLDIGGCPRRYFFENLVHFCNESTGGVGADVTRQREKLVELSSVEGSEELYRYCTREKRTFLEVLRDFPSVKLPLDRLIELIPRISPRYYSISSSLSQFPQQLHLCVAVVDYTTPMRKQRRGLCSSYLSQLQPGDSVRVDIRRGSFHLPPALTSSTVPVILIGPGTGIAPFRAMTQERAYQKMQRHPTGGIVLVCGNRYRERDFLYGQEFEAAFAAGHLQHLLTAFSRDQTSDDEGTVGKVYVQRRIEQNAAMLFELIHEQGAVIYIAGNAKQMPSDVRAAFVAVVQECTGCDHDTAVRYLKSLDRSGRYKVECW
jgi:sulfite reductase alpha subunit-like flavoprotein